MGILFGREFNEWDMDWEQLSGLGDDAFIMGAWEYTSLLSRVR